MKPMKRDLLVRRIKEFIAYPCYDSFMRISSGDIFSCPLLASNLHDMFGPGFNCTKCSMVVNVPHDPWSIKFCVMSSIFTIKRNYEKQQGEILLVMMKLLAILERGA